ncbi:MAG TPA: response regulator transcription factor [Rhizomicrobium sp.]|nr:response regulator transcription factor [Rhizomicrobium sp.]
MKQFELRFLDSQGRTTIVSAHMGVDDLDALAHAKRLSGLHAIEVWEHTRKVAVVKEGKVIPAGTDRPGDYRPRIILVDDDPLVLRTFSRALQSSCEVVASADNGEEGLEAAVRLAPDVMIVDLNMPGLDGLEVCRRVKKLAPETDVIIFTTHDGEEVETAAFQAGASDFVVKQAGLDALESAIQRLAKEKQSGLPPADGRQQSAP